MSESSEATPAEGSSTDPYPVDDSSEEESSSDLTGDDCQERCQTFADITGTDNALAMFYLQERKWNVQRALNDYFQILGGQNGKTHKQDNPFSSRNLYPTHEPPVLQKVHEGVIRILSWNIDGLDSANLQSRSESVCFVLRQENAEVVFLQEVVQRSLLVLKASLTNYHYYVSLSNPANMSVGDYFTAILVRKNCSVLESNKLVDFPTTKMMRNLLVVQCKIHGIPMTLMTSHLESTAEFSEERQRQLRIAFDEMNKYNVDRTVVFGGDLNLRDKELAGISTKPKGVYDLWECTGKRPEAKYTWDMFTNDNKQISSKYQPRCRFDRMYISHSKMKVHLKPVYFELVGLQRLYSCNRFPSDHWGIMSHLSILE